MINGLHTPSNDLQTVDGFGENQPIRRRGDLRPSRDKKRALLFVRTGDAGEFRKSGLTSLLNKAQGGARSRPTCSRLILGVPQEVDMLHP